jgi:hypothetical protein
MRKWTWKRDMEITRMEAGVRHTMMKRKEDGGAHALHHFLRSRLCHACESEDSSSNTLEDK